MRLLSTVIILSAFILMSCNDSKTISKTSTKTTQKENSTKTMKTSDKDILGNWELVKTDCCGRTSKTTYVKESEPKRIIAFNKSGVARYYAQGSNGKMAEQKYTIGNMGTQTTITIGEHRPAIFTIVEDELILSWGYMDLHIETYKRAKY